MYVRRYKHAPRDADRLFSPWGEYSQFLTQIMNCKISHFLNFPLFDSIIVYFLIFCRLDNAAWGGHNTLPPTHQRPPYRHTYWYVDTFLSTDSVDWNTVSSICLNSTQTDSPCYLNKTDNRTLFRVLLHSEHFTVLISNYLQWPRGVKCGSPAARLLILWVPILSWARRSVCYDCCVLSGRGLSVGLITRPEESYRVWCALVSSCIVHNEEHLTQWGLLAIVEKIPSYPLISIYISSHFAVRITRI